MKKLLTITICVFQCLVSFAQFKVHSNGNVSIGLPTGVPQSHLTLVGVGDSTYNFYINDNRNGIFSRATGGNGKWIYGANMSSVVDGSKKMFVGVNGNATSTGGNKSQGRTFGVMGTAGNATNGWNYGVFGRLAGNQNGAGVYGTISKNDNGHELKDRYAGYFNGKVSVRGDLTVRGYIDGIILGPSLDEVEHFPSIRPMSVDDNSYSVSNNISTLNAVSGSVIIPVDSILTNDSALMADTGTYMERQYYTKNHFALSVEEVEAVYPDLVYTKSDGSKVINYIEIIPLLVESIKELKAQIAMLQGGGGCNMMAAPALCSTGENGNVDATDIGSTLSASVPSISQNNPNPFVDITSIRMNIPQTVSTAMLCIYDMSGKQIRNEAIADRGEVTVSVTSEGLDAGMYLYNLIVDGKLVSTRKMILTK